MSATSTYARMPASTRRLRRLTHLVVASAAALSAIAIAPVVAGAADPCPTATACSKTVSTTNGAMTNPVGGTITIAGLNASTLYTLVDALQPLPNNGANKNRFYQGSYSLAWGSCAAGTAGSSTYNIGPNLAATDFASGVPPMTAGPLPTITSDASGNFVCSYTLSFTVSPPGGTIVSARNDIFAMNQGTPVVHLASVSVGPPPLTPPPGIPEAPLMVLLPLSALAVFGVAYLLAYRQKTRVAAH